MPLSVFGHCLCIILYKPRLCSTSTWVRISHRVLVSSPHHHVTVFIPMLSKSTCPLDSFTWHSHLFPPKSISDVGLQIELYLSLFSSWKPPLGHYLRVYLIRPWACWVPIDPIIPNPRSSLRLTQCHLVGTSVLHSPLIGSEQLHKFGTPRLETRAQHTSWSRSPAVTKPHSQSFRSWQPLLFFL